MNEQPTNELPILNMLDPDYQANAHRALRSLREQSPIVRIRPIDGVSVLSAAACHEVLRDGRFGAAGTRTLELAGVAEGPIWDWWRLILFQTNPPIHTRLRALLARAAGSSCPATLIFFFLNRAAHLGPDFFNRP